MAFLRSSVTPFMSAHLNYPKKEATIFDIPISSTSSPHNCIESGADVVAFQSTSDSGRLAVLPLGKRGRTSVNDLSHVFVSNQPLTAFKFLKYPTERDILLTTTRAGNVKLFALKDIVTGQKSLNTADLQFNTTLGPVETLASHKSVSNFFAVGGDLGWAAFDAEHDGQEVVGGSVNGPVKAIDWNIDGNQIAVLQTVEKNRMGTIIDPRSKEVISEYEAHNSFGRECRIIHGGKYVISSGFNPTRFQEIVVYDTVAGKIFIRQQYDKSISFLIPAYDEDSKLLFLGAKGSTLFRHVDVTNMDVASPNQLNCPTQTIGFCLSPKLKCDVMAAEVQKVYQLHSGGIAPIPCNVIRRSYIEFHEELYPDTAGLEAGNTIEEWKTGSDQPLKKVNLRPADAPVIGYIGAGASPSKPAENTKVKENQEIVNCQVKQPPQPSISTTSANKNAEVPTPITQEKAQEVPIPAIRKTVSKLEEAPVKLREAPPPRPTSHTASQVASRLYESRSPYYNIKAMPAKAKTITDVRDINSRISSDGIFFTASGKYAAMALSKIEGTVAIFDLDVGGRIPDGSLDAIFNKAPVLDLQFDPFHDTKILCALSTGVIKVWDISEADYCTNRIPPRRELEPGMRNVIVEEDPNHSTLAKLSPVAEIRCQLPKIVLARYNPVVESLVAVAGSNGDILVVNLETGAEVIKAQYHTSAIVSLSWSSDGSYLISVDRDNVFILSDIRKKEDGILAKTQFKAKSPRAIFTGPIGSEYIFVNYLQGTLHKWLLMDLNLKPIKEEDLGSSQGSQGFRSIYDYDSSIVFMSSKSSPNILMLQITSEGFVQDILQTTLSGPHQAIALMPKKVVDCSIIEIIRMLRITNNSIEIIPFVVPRREKNLFLRELYPNALATWVPSMALEEWLQFATPSRKYVDLKPDDLPELPFEPRQPSNIVSPNLPEKVSAVVVHETIKENVNENSKHSPEKISAAAPPLDLKKREADVMKGWSEAIPVNKDSKMPQDDFQGVEDDEWEEINAEEPN